MGVGEEITEGAVEGEKIEEIVSIILAKKEIIVSIYYSITFL